MAIINVHHWQCKFCDKAFSSEMWYIAHKCKEMERDELFKSPSGQAAFQMYHTWMLKNKKKVIRPESFAKSRYFSSFMKFIEWNQKFNIPDIDVFIGYMVSKQVSPTIWANHEIYTMFMDYYDYKLDPTVHIKKTIDTLFKYADEYKCDVGAIFNYIDCGTIINLLKERKISPWILLQSKKFKELYTNKTTQDQKMILNNLIRPDHWQKEFAKKPITVELCAEYCKELDI